jgi:hypothetical protein
MKLLQFVVGTLLLILSSGTVYAQTIAPSVTHGPDVKDAQSPTLREISQQEINHKREVELKHQEVKEHLKQVPNKHHAQVAEKVHENLNKVNEKISNAWLSQLNHMSEILNKLEEHLKNAEGEGKDVMQAKTAISNAKAKISEAENALNEQTLKVYTITITDPGHIGPDVKKARDILHTNLKTTHKIVKDAHEAVIEATRTTRQTVGGNNGHK